MDEPVTTAAHGTAMDERKWTFLASRASRDEAVNWAHFAAANGRRCKVVKRADRRWAVWQEKARKPEPAHA